MSLIAAGAVTSVDSKPVASTVEGFAEAGDQAFFVNDNADFSPGDQVLVTTLDGDPAGQLYVVDSIDDEAGITFTSPLMEDAPEGTRVALYPLQFETRATVRLIESGEVRECTVLHTLSDALRPGIRDETTSEKVLTVMVGDTRYVFDVIARQTVRDISEALPGVPPAAPEMPELSTLAYLDSMTGLRAQITAAWSPVTENEDGTATTDLDRYEIQTRGTTGDWQTYTSVPGLVTQVFIRDLEPGSDWDVRVRAVDTSKNASDWSNHASITAATDDVPPAQPSRPTATSRFGVITITWDGEDSTGGPMDGDLAYVEIHLSQTTGFTPDESTKVDQIPRAASVVWGPADFEETYYVKLVAVDTSGNTSTASLQEDVLVAPLVDVSNFPDDAMEVLYARTAHFITIDADQITANDAAIGFLQTGTIIGGIFEARDGGEFRTNATPTSGGIRIRDADGFKAWSNGGVNTVTIDRTTGIITATGGNFINGTYTGTLTAVGGGSSVTVTTSSSVAGGRAAIDLVSGSTDAALYATSGAAYLYCDTILELTAPTIHIYASSIEQSATTFLGAIEATSATLSSLATTTAAPNVRVGTDGILRESPSSVGPPDSGGSGFRLVRVPN